MRESEKLDITTGGKDGLTKSVIEPIDIPKLENEEEIEKRIKGHGL